jgi:hypothetical protein
LSDAKHIDLRDRQLAHYLLDINWMTTKEYVGCRKNKSNFILMVFNMKRNNVIDISSQDRQKLHQQYIAFHEAGHAAAIYLNNKVRNLPPVFFKIMFKEVNGDRDYDVTIDHDDCIAKVEGGRLIESLPLSVNDFLHNIQNTVMQDYRVAFEADIINLLIGPLAEAKFIFNGDDKLFNHQVVNLKALKNYGGSSDLALAHEYLESFSASNQLQYEKLDELFTVAFDFVNDDANWKAISKLANYILESNKNLISCEEVVSLIES